MLNVVDPKTEENGRTASQILKCKICLRNKGKYKCPRCFVRTCSLQCCLSHKRSTGCNGKRNVAAFVDRKDYNYFSFLSDYRFLESVDRDNDSRERQLAKIQEAKKSRQKVVQRLVSVARSLNIEYRPSGSALLTCAKLNRTHVTDATPASIVWSLEFRLIDPSTNASQSDPRLWCDRDLNPIRVLVHECTTSWNLADLWRSKVTQLSCAEQDALAVPELNSSIVGGGVKPSSVTSWTLSMGDKLPFFYIECVDRKERRVIKQEIFATSTSLLEVLSREHYVVREIPVIWVAQKEMLS